MKLSSVFSSCCLQASAECCKGWVDTEVVFNSRKGNFIRLFSALLCSRYYLLVKKYEIRQTIFGLKQYKCQKFYLNGSVLLLWTLQCSNDHASQSLPTALGLDVGIDDGD